MKLEVDAAQDGGAVLDLEPEVLECERGLAVRRLAVKEAVAPPARRSDSICLCRACRANLRWSRLAAAVPAARSAACASFTDAGSGRSPAIENSRAAGVASAGAASDRPLEELARRRVARHRAVHHRDHAVRRRQAALQPVLGHHHRGAPVLVQAPELPDELVARHGVELRGGLVEHAAATGRAPSRRRSPRAGARRRRACRCGGRAGAPRRGRAPSPPPRGPPSRPARRGAPAAAPARRARRPSPPASRAPGRPCRTRRPARPGPCSRTSRPPTLSSPLASPPWKCGTRPQSARSSVDLPEPDTPASTVNVPGSSSSVMSRSDGRAASGIAVAEALGHHERLRHGPPPSAPRGRRTARARAAARAALSASSGAPVSI